MLITINSGFWLQYCTAGQTVIGHLHNLAASLPDKQN